MADEVREYIRAAQEAETRGDMARAIDHLRKAATLYRSRGNTARALQMLRHARRLDGSRQDVQEEISRLEWLPDQSLETAVSAEMAIETSDELKAELDKMLHPLDEAAAMPGGDKQLFERGPAKADPQLNAWCSFCCKPRKEVGELVAGPAGAFICAGCLFESARLLAIPLSDQPEQKSNRFKPPLEPDEVSGGALAALVRATEQKPKKTVRHAAPQVSFFGQSAAFKQIEQALARGARLVVIVGPEGTGKSACLAELERKGLGTRGSVEDDGSVLLIDAFDLLPDPERTLFAYRFLDDPSLRAVLSVRADAPLEPVTLLSDDGPFVLHPTSGLVEAIGGKLPVSLADRVDLVAVFEALSDAELKELAQKLAERRASELDLSEPLVDLLVQVAAKSGRGGRELETLIRRIPPGSWNLAPPSAPPKQKKSRARKSSP